LLFIFKNAQNLTEEPKSFNKMEFNRIFEIARISNFNDQKSHIFSQSRHLSAESATNPMI